MMNNEHVDDNSDCDDPVGRPGPGSLLDNDPFLDDNLRLLHHHLCTIIIVITIMLSHRIMNNNRKLLLMGWVGVSDEIDHHADGDDIDDDDHDDHDGMVMVISMMTMGIGVMVFMMVIISSDRSSYSVNVLL